MEGHPSDAKEEEEDKKEVGDTSDAKEEDKKEVGDTSDAKEEEDKKEVGAFLGGWGQSQGLGPCGIASSELCILRDRFPASGARHRTATDFRPRIGLRIRGWALGQCWGPGPENLKHLPK